MWRNGVSYPIIHSLAKHDSHNQCGNSGVNMHDRTSGKVDSTHFLQESSTPHPMGHREISYNHPQSNKQYISGKLYTLGKSTEYQCRRNNCEHALKHRKKQFGNIACCKGADADAVKESLVEASYYTRQRIACFGKTGIERPTIAERHPQNTDYTNNKQRLHDDTQHIFPSNQTAIK